MNSQELFDTTLSKLKMQDGTLWLRILGQTHWQYDELPFWVLVSERDQIVGAIDFLQKELRSIQGLDGADITVSFNSLDHDHFYYHGMFKGEEFFEDGAIDSIYTEPEVEARKFGLYDAEYPNDPWARPRG